eukprot:g9060.t1
MTTSILNANTRDAIEELAAKAVEYDQNQDFLNALIFYEKVVTKIFEISKTLDKHESKKLRKTLQMYIERMEFIKVLLPSVKNSSSIRQLVSLERQPSTENVEKKTLKKLKEDSVKLKALEKLAREDFCCPISHEIMQDPVVCCDGYTYDRKNIEEWWQVSNLSPMTGLPIDSKALIPNHTLKSAISTHDNTMGFSDNCNE